MGLLVVGAVLASSTFELLLQTTVDASERSMTVPEVIGVLTWAIPLLITGLALLVGTTGRVQVLSLTRRSDDQ